MTRIAECEAEAQAPGLRVEPVPRSGSGARAKTLPGAPRFLVGGRALERAMLISGLSVAAVARAWGDRDEKLVRLVRDGVMPLTFEKIQALPRDARRVVREALDAADDAPVSRMPTLTHAAVMSSKAGRVCHLAVVSIADGHEDEDELREELRAFADARKAAEEGERAVADRLARVVAERKSAGR